MSKFISSNGSIFKTTNITDWSSTPQFSDRSFLVSEVQEWTAAGTGSISLEAPSSLIGSFSVWTGALSGTIQEPTITAVFDITLEPFEALFTVKTKLEASLQPLQASFHAGASLDCELLEFLFNGRIGMGLDASLEHLECSFRSGFGETFNINLLELEAEFNGYTNFVAIQSSTRRLTASFFAGSHLKAGVKDFEASFNSIVESIATLNAATKPFEVDFLSGNHIRASLEKAEALFAGSTEVIVSLNVKTQNFDVAFIGESQVISNLSASLRNLICDFDGSSYARSSDDLEATFKLFTASFRGRTLTHSELKVRFEKFLAEFSEGATINASLLGTMENFTANFLSLNASVSCTPFGILEYKD